MTKVNASRVRIAYYLPITDTYEVNVDQQTYFRRRERAERAAAKYASSLEARRVHQELAEAYASKIEGDRPEMFMAHVEHEKPSPWTVLG